MSLALQKRLPQAILTGSICLLIALVWKLVPHPAVVVVFSLIPFALVFVLHVPFLMVLLFVAFSFFRLHEVFPQLYSLKIPLMLSLASLFALFWHIGLTRKIQVYWRKEFVTLSIFFGLVVIGVIMASNRPIAINYFKGIYWKIALMTYAIAWLSRTAADFSLTSRLITVSGVMVGAVAISNKLSGIGLVEETRVTIGRAIGSVLGDPNDLALVLMFPMSFAVSLIMANGISRGTRLLGLFAVPVLFWAVLATQSRGGLLGIMSIFGIYGYRKIENKMVFFGIGSTAAAILYLAAGISDRASGGAAEEGLDASAKGRLYAWEAAFGMAVHNPFTGVGLDNFYSNYYFYSPHWDGLNHAVHSTWFGVLAETGFLGLGVFITLIVQLLLTALRTLNRIEASPIPVPPAVHSAAMAVFAGLMGTIVSGTFLTQGFTWPIYILSAQVIAVANWADKHLPPEPMNKK